MAKNISSFPYQLLYFSFCFLVVIFIHARPTYAADGLFGTYFENIVGSGACDPKSVVTGFYSGADMAYGSRICTDISSLLIFNTLTAPVGQALIGLTNTGSPVFGSVNWTRSGSNIYYTGANVGIGTTAPISKLEVSNGVITNSYPFPSFIMNETDQTGFGSFWRMVTDAKNLRFDTASNSSFIGYSVPLQLNSSGNVGIGNTNPTVRLDVGGVIRASSDITASGGYLRSIGSDSKSYLSPNSIHLGYTGSDASSWGLRFFNSGTTNGDSIIQHYGTGKLQIFTQESILRDFGTGAFQIFTRHDNPLQLGSNGIIRMSITGNGNIGIGTTNPAAKLQVVGGDVLVNGIYIGRGTGTSINNLAIGQDSLKDSLSTASWNVAVGYSNVLRDNITGIGNTGLGGANTLTSNVAGSFNTAIGYAALYANNSGSSNTAIGVNAGQNMTDGNNNTFFGRNAGRLFLSGSGNIAIGYNSQLPSSTGSDQINIGNRIYAIGPNVGIGKDNPTETLDVGGNTNIDGSLRVNGLSQLNNVTILGGLNTSGIANFNNQVTINNGNLILSGGTIGFTDPEKVPWMPRDSNLPFVKFGGLSYIKPQILGSFNGQVVPVSAKTFFFYEQDGSLAGLRDGFNGEYFGLYYMYSLEGKADALTLTSQEYIPAFLKNTGLHAVSVIDGTSDSMTLALANGSGTIVKYVIVKDIQTLDPTTHTTDKVIDITNNITFPAKACNHISEKNMIICTSGTIGALYMYTLDAANNPTKVNLYNTREGLISDSFFNFTNPVYFERVGAFTGYTLNPARIIENLQYELVGDILYVHKLFGSWSPTIGGITVGGYNARTFTVNLIYRININPTSPEYGRVYYENTLPLRTDWMNPNINASVDGYSVLSNAIDASVYKPYYMKSKNQVLATRSSYFSNVSFTVYQFDTISNFRTYWKSLYSASHIYRGAIPTAGIFKVYTPYDASSLGKSLGYVRFIGESTLITHAYSNRFGNSPGSYWTELRLPSSDIVRTVPNFVGRNATSSKPALPLADTVLDINTSDKSLIQQTTLDASGSIIGYIIKGAQILKYTSIDDTITPLVTLPPTYGSTIDADVLATPGRIDATYGTPIALTRPPIRVIDDTRLLVPYIFVYNDASTPYVEKIVYNYNLYTYSASGLTLEHSEPAYHSIGITGRLSVYYGSRIDSTSYVAADGTVYIGFFSNFYHSIGNSADDLIYLKLQSDGSLVKHSGVLAYGSQARKTLGIHPRYGVYWTDSYNLGYTHAEMFYRNVLAIPGLDARMSTSFEDFIDKRPLTLALLSTVRQSDGFVIYTSKTPLFIDGSYTALNENSYDLTLPEQGLVTVTGSTAPIQNKTIYVSIDPASSIATPTLLFTFAEPKTPVIAIIQTNLYGISNIMVKDGLDITSDNIYVKTIKVSNAIEMRGEDGNYYKVYINASGSLIADIIIP